MALQCSTRCSWRGRAPLLDHWHHGNPPTPRAAQLGAKVLLISPASARSVDTIPMRAASDDADHRHVARLDLVVTGVAAGQKLLIWHKKLPQPRAVSHTSPCRRRPLSVRFRDTIASAPRDDTSSLSSLPSKPLSLSGTRTTDRRRERLVAVTR